MIHSFAVALRGKLLQGHTLDRYGHGGTQAFCLMTLSSHCHQQKGPGVGQTLREQQAFHRAHSYPGSVHICGVGNTQKDKFPTAPEFFFWQPTTGHIARFKVTEEPRDTNTGQAQTNIAQGFTIKPEQVFLKWTTSGRRKATFGSTQPWDSRKPSASGSSGLFMPGPLSWAAKSTSGKGCAGHQLGWEGSGG